MDKISLLLQEAKPLYQRKQREKKAVLSGLFSICLCLMVWGGFPSQRQFDEGAFDSYFTALYLNDTEAYDGAVEDEVIPVNAYGLYEV